MDAVQRLSLKPRAAKRNTATDGAGQQSKSTPATSIGDRVTTRVIGLNSGANMLDELKDFVRSVWASVRPIAEIAALMGALALIFKAVDWLSK